ncbi:hypothetical protein ACNKHK_06250 [Shigella flexneri]
MTFAGSVIIPTLDDSSGVEVGAAIAFIVEFADHRTSTPILSTSGSDQRSPCK